MSEPWDALKEGIFETLKEELKDVLEDSAKNLPFLKDVAGDMAKQWWKANHADTPEERQKHEQNLLALEAAIKIRARAESIKIKREAENIFKSVFSTALKILVKVGLSSIPGGGIIAGILPKDIKSEDDESSKD